MQGKESLEQEADGKSYVGIDVCQDWLDVHILPGGVKLRVQNNAQGHRLLKRRLMPHDVALIAIEALVPLMALVPVSVKCSTLAERAKETELRISSVPAP